MGTTHTTEVPADQAGRLLLLGQGLLTDPGRKATPRSVAAVVRRLGFVQVDTINVVARAHDLTLSSRLDGYRPEHLQGLVERRVLFEHFTHDASAIDAAWFVPWRHRCRRMAERPWTVEWLSRQMGPSAKRTLAKVRRRIRDEGPLRSRDFRDPRSGPSEPWWGWKPAKAALEYLWWRGDLTITKREGFQKVYDLTERCYPDLLKAEVPDEAAYVDWACREALDRLTVASPREIRGFHGAVSLAEARAFCTREAEAGRLRRVTIAALDGARPQDGFARPDWRRRLARADKALDEQVDTCRFLSPFDPAIRDRKRALRLFGFDYRFEAFTPQPKRIYGYYVLPVLRGDRLVARADVKAHRKDGVLEIRSLHWEAGCGRTKREHRLLDGACRRLADLAGTPDIRR